MNLPQHLFNEGSVREAAKQNKNILFLVARPLRPLAPPPSLGSVAIGTFFLKLKKKSRLASPPLLVARPLRKELILRLP